MNTDTSLSLLCTIAYISFPTA